MKKNVGTLDKAIRIVLAIIAVVLYLTHVVSGTGGIIVLALAAILLLTSFVSFCPLYLPFKINTGKKTE